MFRRKAPMHLNVVSLYSPHSFSIAHRPTLNVFPDEEKIHVL